MASRSSGEPVVRHHEPEELRLSQEQVHVGLKKEADKWGHYIGVRFLVEQTGKKNRYLSRPEPRDPA